VIQAMDEAFNDIEFVASFNAEGTMSFVLFIAACKIITSNKLPFVFQKSHAIATDKAVTCIRYKGND
jgi:hypothetical protein